MIFYMLIIPCIMQGTTVEIKWLLWVVTICMQEGTPLAIIYFANLWFPIVIVVSRENTQSLAAVCGL